MTERNAAELAERQELFIAKIVERLNNDMAVSNGGFLVSSKPEDFYNDDVPGSSCEQFVSKIIPFVRRSVKSLELSPEECVPENLDNLDWDNITAHPMHLVRAVFDMSSKWVFVLASHLRERTYAHDALVSRVANFVKKGGIIFIVPALVLNLRL